MKKSRKRLLAGVLAGTLALSLSATAVAEEHKFQVQNDLGEWVSVSEVVENQNIPLDFVAETEVMARTVNQVRSAYFTFYQTYGVEKAADVFYNGDALQFVDAFPLIEEGTTFVPLAVFAEAIGATTEYISSTHSVSLEYKGDVITFDIEDTGFYVNGGARQELPFATFVANDRTMVPVRFITDAFKLDLYWNDSAKQVIAADLDSLKAQIAGNYTLMNGFLSLASTQEEGKNVKLQGDMNGLISVDGETISLSSQVETLANQDLSGMSYDMNFQVDLSQHEAKIAEMLNSMSAYPEDVELMNQLFDGLKDFNMNYRYDLNELEFYLQSDLISRLLPQFLMAGEELSVNDDTWYKLAMSDVLTGTDVDMMRTLLAQSSTTKAITDVETLVDVAMELTRSYDNHSMNVYQGLELLLYMTKDSKFVQEETGYSLYDSVSDGGQRLDFVLNLPTDGNKVVQSYSMDLQFIENGVSGLSMTIAQDSPYEMFVKVNTYLAGMGFSGEGNFTIEYTDEKAETVASGGNVIDLINIF